MTEDKGIPKELASLMVFRDFFRLFDDLILHMTLFKEKYGIGLKEVIEGGLAGPDVLQNLVKSLSTQGLGTLMEALADVTNLQNDLANFTSYDETQLTLFHRKLSLLASKLDKVIEERKK